LIYRLIEIATCEEVEGFYLKLRNEKRS